MVCRKYNNGRIEYVGYIFRATEVRITIPIKMIVDKPIAASCDGWDTNQGGITYNTGNTIIVTSSSSGSWVGFRVEGYYK